MEVGGWCTAWVDTSCLGRYFQDTLPSLYSSRLSYDLYYLSKGAKMGLTKVICKLVAPGCTNPIFPPCWRLHHLGKRKAFGSSPCDGSSNGLSRAWTMPECYALDYEVLPENHEG